MMLMMKKTTQMILEIKILIKRIVKITMAVISQMKIMMMMMMMMLTTMMMTTTMMMMMMMMIVALISYNSELN